MDIFIINTSHDINEELLLNFKKKEITHKKTLYTHCLSYLMVDRILREKYAISDTNIEFVDGKPFLKNQKKQFCISHSGDYIALCFSDNNCGIDIELIKNRDYKSIAKRMSFYSNSPEEFYVDWTKYEAEYKLGDTTKSIKNIQYENYMITAVSTNPSEDFQIYIQKEI